MGIVCTSNAVQWVGSEKAMTGTSGVDKATDVLGDECATRIVGLFPTIGIWGSDVTSVRVIGILTHTR